MIRITTLEFVHHPSHMLCIGGARHQAVRTWNTPAQEGVSSVLFGADLAADAAQLAGANDATSGICSQGLAVSLADGAAP